MELHGIFPAEDMSWQREANCLGVHPDLFFPERGASTREAKEVCRGCVVREACLEFALNNGEKFGIWGGMSERERRRIRRARAPPAPRRRQRLTTTPLSPSTDRMRLWTEHGMLRSDAKHRCT